MAAVTEARFRTQVDVNITVTPKPGRSVRIHGKLILSYGTRRVGPRSSSVDVTHQVAVEYHHRADNVRPAAFTCTKDCSDLIHHMPAEDPATTASEHALAALGYCVWMNSARTRLHIASGIVQYVSHEFDDDVPPENLEFDVHLPQLWVILFYSEPKALLLACKESAAETEAAANALARGRKRRRLEPAGEMCAVCLSGVETTRETAVRLPCSHTFHDRCIQPWFHRAPTCPTCRCDIMEYFSSSVRSKSEDEPDISESEQFIRLELRLLDGESDGEALLDGIAESQQYIYSELQPV